jgi:alcohol dehydrogenase class IV
MAMKFEFYTAPEIFFGNGQIKDLPSHCKRFGNRVLLVKGSRSLEESGLLQTIMNGLKTGGMTVEILTVTSEPEVEMIDAFVKQACEFGAEVVVAIGGGSVLDAAKAVAGLVTNGGSIMEYLEGVGTGKLIEKPALPFIAAPTTSGTGTEVTKNAVISSHKMGFKKSIRHQYLIPRIAIIDPVLTWSQSPQVTAACGMDALTQLIEPYVSLKSNPFTDMICLKGIALVSRSLFRAFVDGSDEEARENMSLVSLMGGMALANAGLGSVHGLAAPLGALFPLAHGVACATVLPAAFEINIKALSAKEEKRDVLRKYVEISRVLTGMPLPDEKEAIEAGIAWLKDLKSKLRIPSLSDLGIRETDIPGIVKESRGSSMKTNPIVLSDEEIGDILRQSM